MTETTPRLGLPFIIASQAQKHITHNEALRDLDVLVHLTVEDNTLTTPPADAVDGQCYVVADGAIGDWSGRATQIAVRKDQTWHFYIPKEGWTCWLRSRNAMMVLRVLDGSTLSVPMPNVDNPPMNWHRQRDLKARFRNGWPRSKVRMARRVRTVRTAKTV